MERIDTRNVQTVEIERLNGRIAEHQRLLRFRDSRNNELACICKSKDGTISKQREAFKRFESHASTVIDNLREINTRLHKTIRSQDDTICEMVDEIDELKRKDRHWKWTDGASEGVIESMTILANDNQMKIDDLESRLAARKEQTDYLETEIIKRIDQIEELEAELSARKEDSEVLMEVVDVIKDDTIPNFKVPCMICSIVGDYIDAPEGGI